MATELSLESINDCLLMKNKNRACNAMLTDPDIELFLKEESQRKKDIVDSILKKLEEENRLIENLFKEELAEEILNVAKTSEESTQKKYSEAESDVQKTEELYEAQNKHVNSLKSQLDGIKAQLNDRSNCRCFDQLRQQEKQKEQELEQAKKDLREKLESKTTKEKTKQEAKNKLEESTASKNQVEKNLQTLKENQIKIDAHQKAHDATINEFNDILKMLDEARAQIENFEGPQEEVVVPVEHLDL